jgi:hypothetical protein
MQNHRDSLQGRETPCDPRGNHRRFRRQHHSCRPDYHGRLRQEHRKQSQSGLYRRKKDEAYIVNTELKAKLVDGPIYDMMSNKIQEMLHLPIKSVLLFDIKSVYDQSASPNAGKKLA